MNGMGANCARRKPGGSGVVTRTSVKCRAPSAECRVPSAECRVPSADMPRAMAMVMMPMREGDGDGDMR